MRGNLRQVEELPWQLAALEAWAELAAVLSDPAFLPLAWAASPDEVKSYWAQVEAHSPFRLREAYRTVLDDPEARLEVAWPVALLLGDMGHLDEALALGCRVEQAARAASDLQRLQDGLGVQAVHWRRRGNLPEAMRRFQEQERICRQRQDRAALAANLGNQGTLLRDLGEPDRALELHREAEVICRELGDFAGVAACLEYGSDRVCKRARIGITGVADRAFRATAAEKAVEGKRLDERTIDEASQRAVDDVAGPLTDLHASGEYRLHLARVHCARALRRAAGL